MVLANGKAKSLAGSTSPPPRGQKSLTSFFGAAKSKRTGEVIPPRKVQTGIRGGLKKQQQAKEDDNDAAKKKKSSKKSETSTKKEEEKKTKEIAKENVENGEVDERAETVTDTAEKEEAPAAIHEPADDLMDSDSDDEEDDVAERASSRKKRPTAKSAVERGKKSSQASSRKRVIEDDSDEDEDEDENEENASDEELDEDEYEYEQEEEEEEEEELPDDGDSDDGTVELPEDDDEDDSPSKKSNAKSSGARKKAVGKKKEKGTPPPKTKKQKTLSGKTAAPTKSSLAKSSASSATGSKSEAAARAMKSNAQLTRLMSRETLAEDSKTPTWKAGEPAPYSALCDAFSEIEAVSGRLEIQEKLCTLFRKVLLRDGGGGGEDDDENDDDDEEMEVIDGKDEKKKTNGESSKPNNNNGGKPKPSNDDCGDRSDLYTLLYLTSNSVAPQHENVELGVGDSILIKAIGEASGTAPNMIKKKYDKEGDLGNVAMTAKGKQRTLVGFGRVSGPRRLSCREVLKVFKEIANTSGSQSQKWKVDKIKSLLVRAKGFEPKYIIRGLQGKLRIGIAQTTVLASIAHAVVLTRPRFAEVLGEERLAEIRALDGTEDAYPDFARKLCAEKLPALEIQLDAAVAIVKKAYNEVPSYDTLLDALLAAPLQELHKRCALQPGIPVGPMLAKPTKSVQDVLKRLNGLRFTCEYKYDGERAQVHMLSDGTTQVFSRNLLNTSVKFPEVPLYVQESCRETSVSSFVLDTEVVAFNRETKQFVPFQVLSTRKRTEENAGDAKVQVIVQAFDLMYLNGESLLDKTLAERRDLMKKNFLPIEGKFQYATSLDHTEDGDTTIIEEFLDAAVKGQCEGLMVKTLDDNAAYEPSRRSLNWLKLKKDYLDGLGDSVDLVPLGAYHGKGKRTGVYGAYLLACYDEDTEEFQSVCKIGTGFSDEDLKELAASLNDHTIPEKNSHYNVSDTLACDVWFDAVQVWEVKAADLSKSSTHKGALGKTGESGRGIGLRFPRFERLRPDKKPEQATSSDQILDMYYAQDSVVAGDGGGMDMDGI
eukprot:CAMPEP_0181131290 /NCGR_PEP_ID=MMETSP1071-20121207/30342_1 /TAXON_ID=35127 /ORGANISM="Thalassiosira sp., Strain NH16" /LENGTH=1048 /DNA_ID=CAMNT_0023217465 /DNA_START=142 /DNA_END=3288 /DNA_ORIENTATION=+